MDFNISITRIDQWATRLCKVGMLEHPTYTLHNQDHTANVISNLERMERNLRPNPPLNEAERFCLSAAALMHDLGMLYTRDQLVQEARRENPDQTAMSALTAFVRENADPRNVDRVVRKIAGSESQLDHDATMRTLHGPLAFYLVHKYARYLELDENQLHRAIAVIARSHTSTSFPLNEPVTMYESNPVRVSFLGALLYLADELDFFSNRLPDSVFEFYSDRIVQDSSALPHWTKHFYIKGVEFGREDADTRRVFIARLHAEVPNPELAMFLSASVEESREKLISSGVVSELIKNCEISDVDIRATITESRHAKALPDVVAAATQWLPRDPWCYIRSPKRAQHPTLADLHENGVGGSWVIVAGDRRDRSFQTWSDFLAQGGSAWDVAGVCRLRLPVDTVIICDKYPELLREFIEVERRNVIFVGSPSNNLALRTLMRDRLDGVFRFAVPAESFVREVDLMAKSAVADASEAEIELVVEQFQSSGYISPWHTAQLSATPKSALYRGIVSLARHPVAEDRLCVVAGGTKSYSTMYALRLMAETNLEDHPLGFTYKVRTNPELARGIDSWVDVHTEIEGLPYGVQDVIDRIAHSSLYPDLDEVTNWLRSLR